MTWLRLRVTSQRKSGNFILIQVYADTCTGVWPPNPWGAGAPVQPKITTSHADGWLAGLVTKAAFIITSCWVTWRVTWV